MAREKSNAESERDAAKKALSNGELKERETYTAKQVAYRCGTDAKTMRKFFRSKSSTVEAVGQGGRYEFAATDLPKIKSEFTAWRRKADSRSTGSRSAPERLEVTVDKNKNPVKAQFKPTDGDHNRPTPIAEQVADESDGEFDADQVQAALDDQAEQEAAQAVRDHFGDDHEPTEEEIEEMMRVMADEDLDIDDLDGEEVED